MVAREVAPKGSTKALECEPSCIHTMLHIQVVLSPLVFIRCYIYKLCLCKWQQVLGVGLFWFKQIVHSYGLMQL